MKVIKMSMDVRATIYIYIYTYIHNYITIVYYRCK